MRAELRNHQYEQSRFKIRLVICIVAVLILFGLLAARFYYLQVSQHQHYKTLAERNRIALLPIVPTRGLIYDRNGNALATNFFSYTLEIAPAKPVEIERTINQLAKIIEISPYDRKRFKKRRAETKRFKSVPIRTNLNDDEAAKFAVNHFRFPTVELKSRLFRNYPFASSGAHFVGYIGRINDRDIKKLTKGEKLSNYKGSDHIGKSGIEAFYEDQLHGVTGFKQIEIDNNGRPVRTLTTTPASAGKSVTLSVDMKLQQVAEEAFGERRGALVALDPKTGEVLTYLSKPSYDLNLFVGGIDHENWNRLNNSIDRPLINRPIRGLYPAASTFKPFIAMAGLENNLRKPPFRILDKGFYSLPNSKHRYRDWRKTGHGYVDITKAIIISCDTFFYGLAVELGIKRLADFVSHFGFGKKTGIDLPGEKSGLLPTPEWKNRRYKKPWYAGDTVIVGIGQGYTLVTPMQLAQATATLANDGVSMQPRFATKLTKPTGEEVLFKPIVQDRTLLAQDNIDIVRNAMKRVTLPGGTARMVGSGAPYTVAGKTGTAQVVGIKQNENYDAKTVSERNLDHALFVAYAPADDPKIALAIVVENGEHGGSTAGPIARKVFDYYLLGKNPPNKIKPVAGVGQMVAPFDWNRLPHQHAMQSNRVN